MPKLFQVGGVERLQAQRFFEGIGGVFVTARRRVGIAEVVLRERKAGLQVQRVTEPFDGVVDPAQRLQRVAKIELQASIGWTQVHRATHQLGRFRVLALLMAQHAKQMQGVDMGGFCGERRPGSRVRLRSGGRRDAPRNRAQKQCPLRGKSDETGRIFPHSRTALGIYRLPDRLR